MRSDALHGQLTESWDAVRSIKRTERKTKLNIEFGIRFDRSWRQEFLQELIIYTSSLDANFSTWAQLLVSCIPRWSHELAYSFS